MAKVLILDDEPAVLRLIGRMFKGWSIIEADTAEDALRAFADHNHHIDLLAADVTLPRSSGIQVALLLRTRLRDLPVILTSGYPVSGWCVRDTLDLERLGSNAVAILQKPFQAQVLLKAVRELMGVDPQTETAGVHDLPRSA